MTHEHKDKVYEIRSFFGGWREVDEATAKGGVMSMLSGALSPNAPEVISKRIRLKKEEEAKP